MIKDTEFYGLIVPPGGSALVEVAATIPGEVVHMTHLHRAALVPKGKKRGTAILRLCRTGPGSGADKKDGYLLGRLDSARDLFNLELDLVLQHTDTAPATFVLTNRGDAEVHVTGVRSVGYEDDFDQDDDEEVFADLNDGDDDDSGGDGDSSDEDDDGGGDDDHRTNVATVSARQKKANVVDSYTHGTADSEQGKSPHASHGAKRRPSHDDDERDDIDNYTSSSKKIRRKGDRPADDDDEHDEPDDYQHEPDSSRDRSQKEVTKNFRPLDDDDHHDEPDDYEKPHPPARTELPVPSSGDGKKIRQAGPAETYRQAIIAFLKEHDGGKACMAALGGRVKRPPGVAKLKPFALENPDTFKVTGDVIHLIARS